MHFWNGEFTKSAFRIRIKQIGFRAEGNTLIYDRGGLRTEMPEYQIKDMFGSTKQPFRWGILILIISIIICFIIGFIFNVIIPIFIWIYVIDMVVSLIKGQGKRAFIWFVPTKI